MKLTTLFWLINPVIIVLAAFLMDIPERRRREKQKIKCASGEHDYNEWEFQHEIHNGNDVWERQCRYCRKQETTVSKLTPKK